jgi:glycosyltransferase involved in cell wall biosynthesis
MKVPYVVTEHSTAFTRENPERQLTRSALRNARRVYQHASRIMPVSRSLLEALQRERLPGCFEVLPNPVDARRYGQAYPRRRDEELRIATAARLAPEKSLDVLLRAVASLRRSGIAARVTIMGEGSQRDSLARLARDLGLGSHARFTGHLARDELARELQDAHVFALTSLVENLPVVVIEALCTGLPVVATRVGGVPELIDDTNGLCTPVGDVEAVTRALADVGSSDRFDYEAIRRRAQRNFSLEAVGVRLRSIYDDARGSE